MWRLLASCEGAEKPCLQDGLGLEVVGNGLLNHLATHIRISLVFCVQIYEKNCKTVASQAKSSQNLNNSHSCKEKLLPLRSVGLRQISLILSFLTFIIIGSKIIWRRWDTSIPSGLVPKERKAASRLPKSSEPFSSLSRHPLNSTMVLTSLPMQSAMTMVSAARW